MRRLLNLVGALTVFALFGHPKVAWSQSSPVASGDTEAAQTYPALFVTEVQILRFGDGSHGGVVDVRGLVSPTESSKVQLIAISDKLPFDKVLDLALVAPLSNSTTGDLIPVEATLLFQGDQTQVLGVRVRSGTNVLETKGPVVLAQDIPYSNISSLIGKQVTQEHSGKILVKGTDPSQTVNGVIVKPTDPLVQLSVNPNRLTLFVDNNSRVLYSRWN